MIVINGFKARWFAAILCLMAPLATVSLLYQFLEISDYHFLIEEYHDSTLLSPQSLPLAMAATREMRSDEPIFSGTVAIPTRNADGLEYFFIPSYSGRLVLAMDGTVIFDRDTVKQNQSSIAAESHLFRIPDGVGDTSTLAFDLYQDDTIFVGMSQIYVGSEADMRDAYMRLDFYSQFLRYIHWGAEAFGIMAMLTLFAFGAIDKRVLPLFVILCYLLAVQSPIVLAEYINLAHFVPYIYCFGYMAIWGILAFCKDIVDDGAKRPAPRYFIAALICTCVAIAICMASLQAGRLVHLLITFPVLVFSLYLAGFLSIRNFLRVGRIDAAVFTIGSLTVGVSLMHDIFVRTGIWDSYVLAVGTAAFNFFMCTAFVLISRILSSKRSLATQNKVMEKTLALRTAQLEQEFKSQGELREQNAAAVENERMTRDLHDGVLTYLSMIQSLSENVPAANNVHINSLAKNAIREIRVILEADLLDQNSIFVALSVLRNQLVGPLRNAGVVVSWDLLALLDQTMIDHRHALNIFRILQEAIHNAFQRSRCKVLVIRAEHDVVLRKITISVINSGGSGITLQDFDGNGIRNMRRRASLIGAGFSLVPSPTGAQLDISFHDTRKHLPRAQTQGGGDLMLRKV